MVDLNSAVGGTSDLICAVPVRFTSKAVPRVPVLFPPARPRTGGEVVTLALLFYL